MSARVRRTIAAAPLALLLAAPVAASAAEPRTYAVYSCRGPEGAPISTQAWQADAKDPGVTDTCAEGGALSAEVTGLGLGPGLAPGPGPASAMRFVTPPGTVIAGYRIHLSAATGWAPESWEPEAGLAVGSVVGVPPVSEGCPAADCTFGDEEDPLSDKNLVTGGGLPAAGLVLVARCTAGVCGLQEGSRVVARARIWRSVVDIEDSAPPALGAIGGSLAGPGGVSGRVSADVAVSDAGGGVASVALRVDGVERARLGAGGDCVTPYVVAAPCPATLPAALELDTGDLSDGPQVATVVATDAAGQTTTSDALAFTVDNAEPDGGGGGGGGGGAGGTGGAGTPGPTVVVVAEPARASIALDRTRFTLPARGRQVTGTVRRADGSPAAGAQLVVRSRRFGADAPRPRTEGTVRTDAAGRFSVPLGSTPRRLSLLLDDPGYRTAESDEVQIRGDLSLTLRAVGSGLRNRSVLTLDARIVGAGAGAADGRPVLVQARVGGRWATVDSVEADGSGRARWRYRFRNTTRTTRYKFRVRVPSGGADWPWPPEHSRAVSVQVRP